MRVDLVFPVLPPSFDGIGDHTAHVARGMASQRTRPCDVRILTAQPDATPIPGVRIEKAFSLDYPWQIGGLVEAVAQDAPDWLVVQFNQFSYGRWGLNPFLPLALNRLRRAAPRTKIAWIAHEDFVPAISWKFAIMRLWQRWQFRALGQQADRIFFSIEPWVNTYRSWFPSTPVHHLPIGSNMPRVDENPARLRARLGLTDAFVVGFFGTLRARLLGHLEAALTALRKRDESTVLLYVGPDGPLLREALPDVPLVDAGRLSAEDVSRHLSVMNLHLTPFVDGVSTRRGSFMAGLQHGIPTVATSGDLTDSLLQDADGEAFRLAPTSDAALFAQAATDLYSNPLRRRHLGQNGQTLYDETFAFSVTVPAFLNILSDSEDAPHENNALYAHC